jgi:hypothetical protein
MVGAVNHPHAASAYALRDEIPVVNEPPDKLVHHFRLFAERIQVVCTGEYINLDGFKELFKLVLAPKKGLNFLTHVRIVRTHGVQKEPATLHGQL